MSERRSRRPPSLPAAFAMGFLGMLSAGAVLAVVWYFMSDQAQYTPPLVPSAPRSVDGPVAPPAPKTGRIDGAVYIVVSGGGKQKLGAVHVGLYKHHVLHELWRDIQADAAAQTGTLRGSITALRGEMAQAEAGVKNAEERFTVATDYVTRSIRQKDVDFYTRLLQEAEGKFDQLLAGIPAPAVSSARLFKAIPPPLASAETDEEGKFSLEAPGGGNFVVVAKASPAAAGVPEKNFYWMVRILLEDGGQRTVELTNSNVTSSGSADSLVKTAE